VLFTSVLAHHYKGDDYLEQGVLAELEGKPRPELFKSALAEFQQTSTEMGRLDQLMGELIAIDRKGKLDPSFAGALGKILKDARGFERPSLQGRRYSNVARDTAGPNMARPRNLAEIMTMQREDLQAIRRQMDAFRSVLPLAERNEFAALILSGRQGFSDKIQQSVDLITAFGRFYTQSCMTTIDATMQAYPAGLRWLKDPKKRN
jgi:hypothetical protein